MTTSKLSILCFAVASTLLASVPTMADWKLIKVRHADLDLSTDTGRDRLQKRIKHAVQHVCGSPRAITIKERQDKLSCEKQSNKSAAEKTARIIAASD